MKNKEIVDELNRSVQAVTLNNIEYLIIEGRVFDKCMDNLLKVKPQASELPSKSDLCPRCDGEGRINAMIESNKGIAIQCSKCKGKGRL